MRARSACAHSSNRPSPAPPESHSFRLLSQLEAEAIPHRETKELEDPGVGVEEPIGALDEEHCDKADHAGAPVELLREVAEPHEHLPPHRPLGGVRHPRGPRRRPGAARRPRGGRLGGGRLDGLGAGGPLGGDAPAGPGGGGPGAPAHLHLRGGHFFFFFSVLSVAPGRRLIFASRSFFSSVLAIVSMSFFWSSAVQKSLCFTSSACCVLRSAIISLMAFFTFSKPP